MEFQNLPLNTFLKLAFAALRLGKLEGEDKDDSLG